MDRDLLTVRELAERTGLSKSYLYREIAAGAFGAFRPSRKKLLVSYQVFLEWLSRYSTERRATRATEPRQTPKAEGGRACRPTTTAARTTAMLPFASDEGAE